MIDNGQLAAKIVDGRMVLQLQTDILFDSGSAKLSSAGVATIREVGQLLAELPDRSPIRGRARPSRPTRVARYIAGSRS